MRQVDWLVDLFKDLLKVLDPIPGNPVRLNTVESFRRHRWATRLGALLLGLITGALGLIGDISAGFSFGAFAAMVIAYFVGETLILAPAWATTAKFNGFTSFAAALLSMFGYTSVVPSTEFYKAAAALVPVLFLAFVLEKKSQYQATSSVGDRLVVVLNVLFLVAAGKQCFDVLAFDDTRHGDTSLVIAPIVFTVVSMLISMVTPDERQDERDLAMRVNDPKCYRAWPYEAW